jgi:hypothetical protein
LHKRLDGLQLKPMQFASLLKLAGVMSLRPLTTARRSTPARSTAHTRDAAATSYHYDMSNDFYAPSCSGRR